MTIRRINIQLPLDLKEEIEKYAAMNGESVSAFFRNGASERVQRLKEAEQKKRLEEAYRSLARENRTVAADWEAVDLEGWE